jgi:hypothetical protein
MPALNREQILARKVAGHVHKHDLGDGDTVIIRGLTRDESLEVRRANEAGDLADADNLVIHYGLVEPALSLEDVATWAAQDAAGDLTRLSNHIAEVSGLLEGAGKSRVPGPRKRP